MFFSPTCAFCKETKAFSEMTLTHFPSGLLGENEAPGHWLQGRPGEQIPVCSFVCFPQFLQWETDRGRGAGNDCWVKELPCRVPTHRSPCRNSDPQGSLGWLLLASGPSPVHFTCLTYGVVAVLTHSGLGTPSDSQKSRNRKKLLFICLYLSIFTILDTRTEKF